MAGSYVYENPVRKVNYLRDLFKVLIIRDIRQRYGIRDINLLNEVIDFMVDNSSRMLSIRNITDSLIKKGRKTSHPTEGAYIDCLTAGFAFYRVRRYDLHGKKYLESNVDTPYG